MEWTQVAIVVAVAFIVTYIMVPVSKFVGMKIGAIDYPSNRRMNKEPVPRTGGIALYVGVLAGIFVIYLGVNFFGWRLHDLYVLKRVNYFVLYIGVTMMFLVGLMDDIIQLSAGPKFVGQIIAATVVALSGITIGTVRALDGGYIGLSYAIDVAVTVFYLVVFVNITNLIDGLDGLASGTVVIVMAGMAYLVFMRGCFTLVLASFAVIAACLAFLRFNFFPASVFMGDGGSHLLGLLIGAVAVGGVARTQGLVLMIVPLVIAGVPLLDTFSSIVRRSRANVPIGKADLGHLHHRLMRAGLGQRKSVAMLWACTAVLSFAGCAISQFSGVTRWGIILLLAVVIFGIILKFGLFNPVLHHHYHNKGKTGPRVKRKYD